MPYFIFKLETTEPAQLTALELITSFDAFKQASQFAKQQRADQAADDDTIIKIVFGENQLDAEEKFREKREPHPQEGD